MAKVLHVDHQKCTGCQLCELVCAVSHDGISNPARSRIRVVKWEAEGLYIPMTCQQCQDAPCLNVCPVKAISRNEELAKVAVDYDVCIGCRSCVSACPFGAMIFNPTDRQVFKCDLCDGDPQCARFCEVKAVDFIESDKVSINKRRKAAERVSSASKEAAALEAQL
ncbi:MAG: 4Fe-4S dicluster domain-containing protein [Desulfobacterales bacterium]